MYVRYRSMTLSDTCTIRRSWTLHAVPGLPDVAWVERGNILLARSFHAAHYECDSCENSAWKYRGNIVRWTWILQRFNEERNPFLVCGKTWLIITFRCVYCTCPWVTKISHFWTWIPLKPVNLSWSNFMCSIIGVGERLHKVLGQIGSKLWFPWQQKAPVDLKWGKWCLHLFLVVFDRVLLILAGNEDVHKISDEFKFRSDQTTDYGVSCPWVSKKFPIDL